MKDKFAVIMAGGRGTRFWPLSAGNTPKQFLRLLGKESLIQATVNRLKPLFTIQQVIIVTAKDQYAVVKEQLKELPEENILLEPEGKNTAACIGLAAVHIRKKSSNSAFVVMPSDHIIKTPAKLRKTLKAVFRSLDEFDSLHTIGFKPLYPETGYGYIKMGRKVKKIEGLSVCEVEKFTEKPSLKVAKRYVESGNYFWNSGIFGWSTDVLLDEMKRYTPNLYKALQRIEKAIGTSKYQSVLKKEYKKLENISIDYALLEKSKNILMIPSSMNWTDIGSWDALENVFPKDRNGNISSGDNYILDSQNNIAFSREGSIVLQGVKDLIVVKSGEKVFVCRRNNSQQVRKVVEFLEKKERKDLL